MNKEIMAIAYRKLRDLERYAKESIALNPDQAERLGGADSAVQTLIENAIEKNAVEEYIKELRKDIETKKRTAALNSKFKAKVEEINSKKDKSNLESAVLKRASELNIQ